MAELDWVQHWFMFPVSTGIATTAMLSGIGGAALFIPIFVTILPVLGPEYPLTTAAAIGAALMAAGGLSAIPRNLVVYTVPAVIIGGQIGPRLQDTIPQRSMGKTITILFGIIGVAMAFIVSRQLGVL